MNQKNIFYLWLLWKKETPKEEALIYLAEIHYSIPSISSLKNLVDKLYDSLPAWGKFRTDKSEL